MTKKILFGTFLMAFAIGVGVSSCTKDDNNSTNPDVTDTTGTGGGNDNPADTTGGATEDNTLIPATFPERHVKQIIYTYDGGDKLDTTTISFTWNGDVVSRIDYTKVHWEECSEGWESNIAEQKSYTFDYENGRISRSTITETEGDAESYEYLYDADGRLIKQIMNDGREILFDYSSDNTIIIKEQYYSGVDYYTETPLTWTNANITSYVKSNHNYSMTYDAKRNPVYMPFGVEVESIFRRYFCVDMAADMFWWSKNNVKKFSGNAHGGFSLTFSFSYDGNNYPTRLVSGQNKTQITYYN